MAILVIHGGAGTIGAEFRSAYEAGLHAALAAGQAALQEDTQHESRALAAVLAAVTSMESNPEAFNAGVGGALTNDGKVELDACVMVSNASPGHHAGAVAGVSNTANPVLLADSVRRTTPHVLLIGAGAEQLVSSPAAAASLITDRSRAALERWKARNAGAVDGSNTVGAVALDDDGNLAAATSTGGVTGQWSGRVGDAPLPGLGTYADGTVAVSCTGKGEAFIEAAAASRLKFLLEAGASLEDATRATLDSVRSHGGNGGLIAVTAAGQLVVGFNSEHIAWGVARDGELSSGVAEGAFIRVE